MFCTVNTKMSRTLVTVANTHTPEHFFLYLHKKLNKYRYAATESCSHMICIAPFHIVGHKRSV